MHVRRVIASVISFGIFIDVERNRGQGNDRTDFVTFVSVRRRAYMVVGLQSRTCCVRVALLVSVIYAMESQAPSCANGKQQRCFGHEYNRCKRPVMRACCAKKMSPYATAAKRCFEVQLARSSCVRSGRAFNLHACCHMEARVPDLTKFTREWRGSFLTIVAAKGERFRVRR